MELSGLQQKIFLDRYAMKETDPSKWAAGQKVVALIAEDPKQPLLRKTIVGNFVTLNEEGKAVIHEPMDAKAYFVTPGDVEYPKEQRPEEMWDRIAHSLASVEEPEKQAGVEADFRYALDDFKLVPGGRVMAGAGTDNLTLINCFVTPSPHDSRRGIFESVADMADIMARGGGVGVNLSSLRPRRELVRGVNGHSSGSVPWGGLFSYVTGLIEQGK